MMSESHCSFSARHPKLFLASVLLVFATGFLVRVARLNEAPRDFWTVRQYSGALIARVFYFDGNSSVPEWRREVVSGYMRWLAEPPVLEVVSAAVFRLIGSEQFWVPRTITTLSWVLGGLLLFLSVRRLLTPEAGLAAAMFHLFLPYSMEASRSWQPDALMVAGLCGCLLCGLRYFERPSAGRLALYTLVSALTTFVKPGGSLLMMFGLFAGLSLLHRGFLGSLKSPASWFYAVGSVLPSGLAVLWSRAQGWYQPGWHFTTYLSFHLLGTLYFWKGWAGVLIQVFTLPGLLAAAAGFFLLRGSRTWAVVAGYGGGYIVQSLLFSFTTPNHDYWHLLAVPLLGIGVAGLVPRVMGSSRRAIFGGVLTVFAVLWLAAGVFASPWVRRGSDDTAYVNMARSIGESVGHSRRVVFLDYDVGNSLKYFAEIDGWYWPESELMAHHRLGYGHRAAPETRPELSAADRFSQYYATNHPEYFVICRALQELDRQPGLRDFLFSNFPVVTNGDRFIVFDLRRRDGPELP